MMLDHILESRLHEAGLTREEFEQRMRDNNPEGRTLLTRELVNDIAGRNRRLQRGTMNTESFLIPPD